jgi:hypothetical protein
MENRVEKYLAKAKWCADQADKATDPEVVQIYLTLARGWRTCAGGLLARRKSLGEDDPQTGASPLSAA